MWNLKTNNKHLLRLATLAILLITTTYTLHAQQFQFHFLKEFVSTEVSIDSTLKTLKVQLEIATTNMDSATRIKCLLATSSFNRYKLDYSVAFDNAGEALFLAEEYKDTALLAKAHENFGVLNYIFRQDELAEEHFTKSLYYYKKAFEKKLVSKWELFYPNYNMVLHTQRLKDSETCNKYISICEEIINSTRLDTNYTMYLNLEKASILNRTQHFSEAEHLLLKTIETVNKLSLKSEIHTQYHPLLLYLYTNLARLYEKIEDEEKAGIYFKKAVDTIVINGNQAFFISHTYSAYASWLYRGGDYYKAYLNLKKAKQINDKHQNARRPINHSFLSVRDRYSEELQKKNEELTHTKIELGENRQEILRTRIILFVILLLALIATFIIRTRLQHLKHQKENEINRKKEHQAKELLAHKNREITSTMLQLIETKEMLNSVTEHLKNNEDKDKTIRYINSLDKQSSNLWEAFNCRFIEQNNGFYERLQEKVPELSSNDLKICALIKLNFSGKEMATLLGISMGSVHVARHRLRKKMHIERDVNLTGFVNSI